MRSAMFTAALLVAPSLCAAAGGSNRPLLLWYQQPARQWTEALPVGNGRLGAMVFGGVRSERIQLNENTVWTGWPDEKANNPEALKALPEIRSLLFAGKYAEAQRLANAKLICGGDGSGHGRGAKVAFGSYQSLGDLWLEFDGLDDKPAEYRRQLDLDVATCTTRFQSGGVTFTREVFASAPQQVLVIRITASQPGKLTFSIALDRDEKTDASIAPKRAAGFQPQWQAKPQGDRSLVLSGRTVPDHGVRFAAVLDVAADGGRVRTAAGCIRVEGATAATLRLAAATDYRQPQADPVATCQARLAAASAPLEELKARHLRDYQKLFRRVDLTIGTPPVVDMPTDQRLQALQKGAADPQLAALFFQYGRYLLIGSSRPGGLPANLQGLWCYHYQAPWNCDYHANINVQMNYWPAEPTNLAECHLPLLDFIDSIRDPGHKTAQVHYGARGWTAHTIINVWGFTAPGESPGWGLFPMAGPWMAQHLWEHYAFGRDEHYLAQVYPALRESAQFCLDWLVRDPKSGKLVSGPANSPENSFILLDGKRASLCMGPSMDQQIIFDLFTNFLEASQVLAIDDATVQAAAKARADLLPPRVGADGRLLEWPEEFKEAEPGHRHMSHLFALHPGRQITREGTPDLAAAVRKSLDHRLAHGGAHTGWSRAWLINFLARLADGDGAAEHLGMLLKKSTLPNLFDNHPPFQIDGNFGATAAVAEMLVQSHAGEVVLLPALPKAWPTGYVRGLRARGGLEVTIDWADGHIREASLAAHSAGTQRVRLPEGATLRNAKLSGKALNAQPDAKGLLAVDMQAGDRLELKFGAK